MDDDDKPVLDKEEQEYLDAAIRMSGNFGMWEGDDVELDEAPAVSLSEGGAWVRAWVWIPESAVKGESGIS